MTITLAENDSLQTEENQGIAEIPFRMGDVVLLHSVGQEHIIHQIDFSENSFEYSTNLSAWHTHAEFTLVRPADVASLTKLRQAIEAEDEDMNEDPDHVDLEDILDKKDYLRDGR